MSPSIQFIISGIAIALLGVVALLLLIPYKPSKPVKPQKGPLNSPDQASKSWQETCLKLERHIQGLRRELEEYQRKEKASERERLVQLEKYNKLQEKLAQERDWQKKEEDEISRKSFEIQKLKVDLKKVEDELSTSVSERLRYEREKRELKDTLDTTVEQRRNFELQIAKLTAENEAIKKELRELKDLNSKLSDKKEAESWVAKTDYEKLLSDLRNREKDLAQLREQLKKEML